MRCSRPILHYLRPGFLPGSSHWGGGRVQLLWRGCGDKMLSHPTGVSSPSLPVIRVTPAEGLVDDEVSVTIVGLEKFQLVTIHASFEDDGMRFAASSCYTANGHGTVDVGTQPSEHGTYTGVETMGLFWSMQQAPGLPKRVRFIKKDFTSPFTVHFLVFRGHHSWEEVHRLSERPLTGCSVKRWYKAEDVTREMVREGMLRGAYFKPPGNGPFPGVIDMFGTGGGLIEFRASLLASRGFAVLALAYFHYDDIPPLDQLDLTYFQGATDWLLSKPEVIPRGVGVLGMSKGAEIAMVMGTYIPRVSRNDYLHDLDCQIVSSLSSYQLEKMEFTDEGLVFSKCYDFHPGNFIPVWESDTNYLLIAGEDDHCYPPSAPDTLYDAMPDNRKRQLDVVHYAGAGHLIEPPFSPYCRASYHHVFGKDTILMCVNSKKRTTSS
ncbi:hypothetical protein ScPMuIL_013619 [Solemya velum]